MKQSKLIASNARVSESPTLPAPMQATLPEACTPPDTHRATVICNIVLHGERA